MQHGVKCVLFAATQANANRVRDALAARLPADATVELAPFAQRYHDGRFYAACSVLLPTEAAAGQFLGDVQALWTSGGDSGRIVAGSYARRFRSFDDEPRDQHGPDEEVERRHK